MLHIIVHGFHGLLVKKHTHNSLHDRKIGNLGKVGKLSKTVVKKNHRLKISTDRQRCQMPARAKTYRRLKSNECF